MTHDTRAARPGESAGTRLSRRSFVAGAGRALALACVALPGVALASSHGTPAASSTQDASDKNDAASALAQADAEATRFLDVARADLSSARALISSLANMAHPSVAAAGERITDSAGASFAMPVAAERIICLNSNVYDMICAFGKAGTVIGLNDSTAPDPSTPNVRSFGDLSTPNVEAIIEAQPDLVICYSTRIDEGVASQIEDAGIPLAHLDLYKPAPCAAELTFLGNVLGVQQQAAELLAIIGGLQQLVAARTADLAPLRTYWEIYADHKSAGAGSGADQLMELAGVENLAHGEGSAHVKVSDEWVIEANPQFIVRESSTLKGATGAGVTSDAAVAELYDSLLARPGWGSIDAVRDGRVIVLDTTITTNPLGFAIAPLFVAQEAYPERFADFPSPDDVLAEMLTAYWPGQDRTGIYAYRR